MAVSSSIEIWFPHSCTAFNATLNHMTTSTVTEIAALRAARASSIEQPACQWEIFWNFRASLHCFTSYPKDQLVIDIEWMTLSSYKVHHDVELRWIAS